MRSYDLTERELPYIIMALGEYGCKEWTVSSDRKLTGEISVRKARLLKQRAYELYRHYRDYIHPMSDVELFHGQGLADRDCGEDELVDSGTITPRQWKKVKTFYGVETDEE